MLKFVFLNTVLSAPASGGPGFDPGPFYVDSHILTCQVFRTTLGPPVCFTSIFNAADKMYKNVLKSAVTPPSD